MNQNSAGRRAHRIRCAAALLACLYRRLDIPADAIDKYSIDIPCQCGKT
jgi:hypothetical protein